MKSNVKSALDIKNYKQNVYEMTKVKKHVDDLEKEIKRLMAEIEMTRKTLMEAEKSVAERAVGFKLEHGIDTFLNQL